MDTKYISIFECEVLYIHFRPLHQKLIVLSGSLLEPLVGFVLRFLSVDEVQLKTQYVVKAHPNEQCDGSNSLP